MIRFVQALFFLAALSLQVNAGVTYLAKKPAAGGAWTSYEDGATPLEFLLDFSDTTGAHTDGTCVTPVTTDGDTIGSVNNESSEGVSTWASSCFNDGGSGNATWETGVLNGNAVLESGSSGNSMFGGNDATPFSSNTVTSFGICRWPPAAGGLNEVFHAFDTDFNNEMVISREAANGFMTVTTYNVAVADMTVTSTTSFDSSYETFWIEWNNFTGTLSIEVNGVVQDTDTSGTVAGPMDFSYAGFIGNDGTHCLVKGFFAGILSAADKTAALNFLQSEGATW